MKTIKLAVKKIQKKMGASESKEELPPESSDKLQRTPSAESRIEFLKLCMHPPPDSDDEGEDAYSKAEAMGDGEEKDIISNEHRSRENDRNSQESTPTPSEQTRGELDQTYSKMMDITGANAAAGQSDAPLNVAVIGALGVGKSTFINTLCGFRPVDSQAARINHTNLCPMLFNDPGAPHLFYWECPPLDYQQGNVDLFLKRLEFDKYDVFLLLSNEQFSQEDVVLAESLTKEEKLCYLIRTKVDTDIADAKATCGKAFKESSVVQDIRSKSTEHLGEASDKMPVFLVNNNSSDEWDFPLLMMKLAELSPSFMNQALESDVGNKWQTIPLNMAIIGNSGVGKSSLINSMRSLRPDQPMAASVGTAQTTMCPTPYPDIRNPNLQYWDLPGVGTPEFPVQTYLEQIQFDRYDFFLILSCARFTENDFWLAKEIHKSKRRAFFIRTKIDVDIASEQNDYPELFDEAEFMVRMRKDCVDNLKDVGQQIPVFLISTRMAQRHTWDFPKLIEELVSSFPKLKRNAMILSMAVTGKGIIESKYGVLKKRILWLSAISAGGGAVPVPGVSMTVDIPILVAEVKLYKRQFGLDEQSLQNFSQTYRVPVQNLHGLINRTIGTTAAKTMVVEALGIAVLVAPFKMIPGVGSAIGFVTSGISTGLTLHKILKKTKAVALDILDTAFNQGTQFPTETETEETQCDQGECSGEHVEGDTTDEIFREIGKEENQFDKLNEIADSHPRTSSRRTSSASSEIGAALGGVGSEIVANDLTQKLCQDEGKKMKPKKILWFFKKRSSDAGQ